MKQIEIDGLGKGDLVLTSNDEPYKRLYVGKVYSDKVTFCDNRESSMKSVVTLGVVLSKRSLLNSHFSI